MQGRVIKGIGGFYYISHDGQVIQGTARGILKRGSDILYVGDIVNYEMIGDDEFVITEVIERRNFLERPPVSNLDKLIVTFAAAHPEPNFYVIDKLCVGAEVRGIDVVICITKSDLVADDIINQYANRFRGAYPVVPVCALTGAGVDGLTDQIHGSNAVLAGASGVGKSTLLNRLVGTDAAEVGSISDKRKRGRHTTRSVCIYELPGGTNIYDTPGFSSLDVPFLEKTEIARYFPEFRLLRGNCRYSDCIHVNEPDCAVKDAVARGDIDPSRYASYKMMLEEVAKWQK
ncbi:MAG: ribosome small subunit-dependent GTPase A [Mogibacterium sp.]|nr:ribosome small subunit-dependent GTPase A [Mogibacterium sp.]